MHLRRFIPLLLLCVALVGLSGFAMAAKKTASPFTLKTLSGESVSLEKALETGPVVISFWATWCRPCMVELPELEALHQEYKDKGVTILAVSADEARDRASVQATVKRLGLTMPVLLDADASTLGRYNPSKSLPFVVMVNKDGTIRTTHTGYSGGFQETMGAELRSMLRSAKKE